jgi:hypothetical protein
MIINNFLGKNNIFLIRFFLEKKIFIVNINFLEINSIEKNHDTHIFNLIKKYLNSVTS